MPPPLSADQVTYTDGTPQTVDQYATRRVGLPDVGRRAASGRAQAHRLQVVIFLIVFAGLMYLTKKRVWSGVAH